MIFAPQGARLRRPSRSGNMRLLRGRPLTTVYGDATTKPLRRGGSYGRIEPTIFSREMLSVIMPCLTAAAYHVRYQRVASATSGPASAP
jgi:hypothetical protein